MKRLLLFIPFLILAIPMSATIIQVQSVVNSTAAASTLSVTTTSTTNGNLILVFCMKQINAATLTITDNQSNTYTAYTGFNNINLTGGNHAETDIAAYTVDAHGGVTSVTCSGGAADNFFVSVTEANSTNGWPVNPTDKSATQYQGGVTSFSSTATATIAQASEFLWGIDQWTFDPGTITPTNSFVLGSKSALVNSRVQYQAYRIVTSAAAYTFTGTNTSSADSGSAILTFKDNAGGAGGGGGFGGTSGIGGKAGFGD